MYMSRTGRFALPRVRVVSPRRRGMLCSGKCCHRGQGTGKRGAHFFFKSSSSLSSPLPRKSLKLSAGPSGVVRAREARHVGGRRRRARTERSPDPHTKLSVYSIDIVRLTPRQQEFRTCAPTKRHRKLPPQASVRAPPAHGESHPVLCKNRLRARIRRPCRPRSRRPSCSRGSAASKTSLMTFWPWKLEERRPESEGEVAARQRNVR